MLPGWIGGALPGSVCTTASCCAGTMVLEQVLAKLCVYCLLWGVLAGETLPGIGCATAAHNSFVLW